MRPIKYFLTAAAVLILAGCSVSNDKDFIRRDGTSLRDGYGNEFFIRGTNLGNWLNPEGYMFHFPKSAASYGYINEGLCQMAGPEYVDRFWKRFVDRYITRDDIEFIASIGANTVRVPFHYKLFQKGRYMGQDCPEAGYEILDKVVGWCKDSGIRVILDMHDCPGGQTGDNIDDSYGYPWLFTEYSAQDEFIRIWTDIARHFADEPTVLGYDFMNEPIAHYFADKDSLNARLPRLMTSVCEAVRKVDSRHIFFIGGAQWNGNFKPFSGWTPDPNSVFTCHIYGCPPKEASVRHFARFRDESGFPMYMGETGENTDEWVASMRETLESLNIGWTFWTYKRLDASRCFVNIPMPVCWLLVQDFLSSDRSTYSAVREARPGQGEAEKVLNLYLDNLPFAKCTPNMGYIKALFPEFDCKD